MRELNFDAVIFDLDGVITKTALAHSAAWKKMFDEYLLFRENKNGEEFREFTHDTDYITYVDGKPRYDGVESFLLSRNINIPKGTPEDSVDMETVCGLGNKKNDAFNSVLSESGVETFPSTVALIHELRENDIRLGVASSSRNCRNILDITGLADLFETRVDGEISAELGLNGKPEPDIFTTACSNLGCRPHRSVVVEDAVSGVQAGRAGNFGLVIGISREGNDKELRDNGADIVVSDLSEISIDDINNWFIKGLESEMWSLSYNDFDPGKEKSREALLTIGNGYMGTRGAMEETFAGQYHYPGTYLSGLYNKLPSEVGGKTVYNEDFVNIPNWLCVTFKIDNEAWINLSEIKINSCHRNLNFKTGILSRSISIEDKKGRKMNVFSQRTASMDNMHAAGLTYVITPLNFRGTLTIKAGLNGNIINDGVERYRQLNQKHLKTIDSGGTENFIFLQTQTTQSGIDVVEVAKFYQTGMSGRICPVLKVDHDSEGHVSALITIDAEENEPVGIEKLVSVFTSRESSDPMKDAKRSLRTLYDFTDLVMRSAEKWQILWNEADIRIEGDRMAQKLTRLHIYHTLITASHNNISIDAGIPARGLHGEAYRGHVFWDELYIMPFYNLHFPEIAQALLKYRYTRLGAAKKASTEAGYKGAMFPWQSGSAGTEETQTIHLNPASGKWGDDYSCLQRHVSLAIAYNVISYYTTTRDKEFLSKYGLEMLVEICRFWASKCEKNSAGRYSISGVMGPDEFHEKYPEAKEGGLKDNAYTNIMVSWLMEKTIELISEDELKTETKLVKDLSINKSEIDLWKLIHPKLNVYISEDGIIEQFDGYFKLDELNWKLFREKYGNIHRMDRILKAENQSPDHYKVAKQADTLMLFYNLPQYTITEIIQKLGYSVPDDYVEKNFNYYLQRTSHGSSLSRLVHSYVGLLCKNYYLSWELYREALESDFSDIQGGTTAEGIHAGVMTGSALLAITGFAGVDIRTNPITIAPNLPGHWDSAGFSLLIQSEKFEFFIDRKSIFVQRDKLNNSNIKIQILQQVFELEPEGSISVEYYRI